MTKRIASALPVLMLMVAVAPSQACDPVPFKREPTIAEMVAGLDVIFAGTVVGYEKEDGTRLLGPIPRQCFDEYGSYAWWDWEEQTTCSRYLDVSAALFRVDVHIVGPEAGELVSEFMTWGDGDCNTDYEIGDEWLIAGYYTRPFRAPLQASEIALLQKLAAHPAFDFKTLY